MEIENVRHMVTDVEHLDGGRSDGRRSRDMKGVQVVSRGGAAGGRRRWTVRHGKGGKQRKNKIKKLS